MTTVFRTIGENFGRLIKHQTSKQKLEETNKLREAEDVTPEKMFELEQHHFRISKPTHGPRAGGGSVGGLKPTQAHRTIPTVDVTVIQVHQDHSDQHCAHPTCPLCSDPDYKWRDVPMFGKKHEFGTVREELPEAKSNDSQFQRVQIRLEEGRETYYMGTFEPDKAILVRHLCCVLCPKAKSRYKRLDIPTHLIPLVPSMKVLLTERLKEHGIL